MIQKRYKIREEIAWRKMKDGTITIVSPVVEKIISINETAGVVWEIFEKGGTAEDAVAALSNIFSEDLRPATEEIMGDVAKIINDFIERHLLEEIVDKSDY